MQCFPLGLMQFKFKYFKEGNGLNYSNSSKVRVQSSDSWVENCTAYNPVRAGCWAAFCWAASCFFHLRPVSRQLNDSSGLVISDLHKASKLLMDHLTLCKSRPLALADGSPFFLPLCSSRGFIRGSLCCLFYKGLPRIDGLKLQM